MNKLKILQTPVRFYPNIGGVENHVYYLSKELVSKSVNVKVLCANEPKSSISDVDGIKVERLGYPFKIANTNITLSLPFKILRSNFDIIHTHMPTPWSADISILIGKIMKKRSIITIHNDMDKASFISKIFTKIYLHTIFILSLCLVNKIIIVNKDWEKSFINTSGILKKYQNKITVLPNGVDTHIFKPLNVKNKKNTVLFVSNLDKHHKFKGLDYLLEAIKIVKLTIPDIRLIIVGDGELKKIYMSKASALNITDYVDFIGEKKQIDLVKLYSSALIFVLPSIEIEGFGIVAIEAMACKTPVIATEIVGVSKDIKKYDTGLVIKSRNSKALAKSIIKLVSDKKRAKEMGKNGSDLVKGKYDWNLISKQVKQVYREVLS